ncbi:MAG: hypothetical protein Q8P25_04305 [Candidatus Curtissbacteria bacterium]|nr:hypothetical protein [Candidatus Curtissbacteria bacterium]
MSRNFYIAIFSLSLFLSIYLFHKSIDLYFFQDDFFEINISDANNMSRYLSFFKFRDDIIAYRPITLQNYFFVSGELFGLNPAGFRLVTFVFFLADAFLISKVIAKITQNSKVGLMTASLWLTSAIHFMALSWIAAAYNILGTFFWLLTAYLYLKFQQSKKGIFFLFSFLAYLLAIGSFEFSITWPIIFAAYSFVILKNKPGTIIKHFSPFVAVTVLYLILRLLLIKVPQIEEYKIALNLDSVKALFWYFLWTFNIPEEFKKQIINNLIFFRERFLIDYWFLVSVSSIGALWTVVLAIGVPLYRNYKREISVKWKFILFCLFWFAVGISPVLLLPNHNFAMYLTLSSIGIYMLIAYLLVKNSQRAILIFSFVLFVLSSAFTVRFYYNNSWIFESQKFARNFATGVLQTYPNLPANSVVLYEVPERENRQALLFSNALRAVYNDASLTIYYNKSELVRDIQQGMNRPVYIYP